MRSRISSKNSLIDAGAPMRKGISGQISVFLAITMVGVLALAGLLVDLARINAGHGMVKRAVDLAAGSLLADYSSRLKDQYGLFAIQSDIDELEDRFYEYLTCNLSIPCDDDFNTGSIDLFGFRIERVEVIPIYNLSENDVTKRQILEHMKYRAPAGLVEDFIEKLTAVRDVGKMSDAYKQKVGIDKILGRMDKSQQKLKKAIEGTGSDVEKFINGFNKDNIWVTSFNEFNSLTESLSTIETCLDSVDSSISGIEAQLAALDDVLEDDHGLDGQNGRKYLESKLKNLINERSRLKADKSDMSGRLSDLWQNIRNDLTSDYIKSNETALKEIANIAERGQKARQAIDKLEEFLRDNFPDDAGLPGEGEISGDGRYDADGDIRCGGNDSVNSDAAGSVFSGEGSSFSKDFRKQMQAELDNLKELILEGQEAEKMLESINANITVLNRTASKMDMVMNDSGGFPAEGLPAELLEIIKDYTNIDYDYSRPDKGDKTEDPRAGKADAVKSFIYEKLLGDVNYETAGVTKEELPSYTKVRTKNFDEEDEKFNEAADAEQKIEGDDAKEASYNGDLENVADEADLYDEEGMFQENTLAFISNIGNIVSGQAAALRDSIYVNEYIMGTFKNSVPSLVYGTDQVKDTDLHGYEKEKRETFYDSEVEYILHGNASQNMNNILTKGELMLVRIALNTLHVYTDPAKRTKAASIAAAVAGWWTGGAGIPVITNLIMCGWGVGESVIDVIDLMEGRSVPIYKMKGDWRLDIGIEAQAGPKTDQRLYFNYHDYLRLFLLTVSDEKKLSRIEDLIQLNIGESSNGSSDFRISECNTYVRIEAEVSMKFLFITQPFMRKDAKTGDGRHLYKVLLYEGY